MAGSNEPERRSSNGFIFWLAILTIGFAAVGIALLAVVIILTDGTERTNTMTVFNVLVPVFASWVGTVLAFYFGRENFESANDQVRKTSDQVLSMAQLTIEQRAAQPVSSIMRSIDDTKTFTLPVEGEEGVTVGALLSEFTAKEGRLPLVDTGRTPKYMVHKSAIDGYVAPNGGGDAAHSLKQFVDAQSANGRRFDLQHGFAIVSVTSTVAEAKAKLEALSNGKDVFVTTTGKSDEAILG